MSTTRPCTSSGIVTRSPIRIGWVKAISTPETRFAITCRPAKPMMMPSTAVDASTPVAKRLIDANWLRASATRIVMAAEISSPCSCQKLCSAARIIASGSISSLMIRAVFLDALGTLVELEPPWIALRNRVPPEVSDERLVAALHAEMDYYRGHAHEGRDEASLAELRESCAAIVSGKLGFEISVDELVDAIRFDVYPDVEPALGGLRERGLTVVAVSNWDYSLPRVLVR